MTSTGLITCNECEHWRRFDAHQGRVGWGRCVRAESWRGQPEDVAATAYAWSGVGTAELYTAAAHGCAMGEQRREW